MLTPEQDALLADLIAYLDQPELRLPRTMAGWKVYHRARPIQRPLPADGDGAEAVLDRDVEASAEAHGRHRTRHLDQ